MKVDSLKDFRPINNHILIRPHRNNDEYSFDIDDEKGSVNRLKLYIDTSFEPEKHACVVGEVIRVPDTLFYSELPHDTHSMPWLTDMELKQGDTVWYNYLAAVNAVDPAEPKYVVCDGDIYFLVNYSSCFVAKRIDKVIPLNGYVLCEPVYDAQNSTFIELPEDVKSKHNDKVGIVSHIGSLNQRYRSDVGMWPRDYTGDQDVISVGDKVVFDKACDIALEYDFHSRFEGNKKFFRVQRRYLSAVLEK